MHKSLSRRLLLAAVLGTLSGTIAHADTTTPPPSPTPGSVTGGDPVPTSPHAVMVILTLLQVLL
jgi:hypothetical protein